MSRALTAGVRAGIALALLIGPIPGPGAAAAQPELAISNMSLMAAGMDAVRGAMLNVDLYLQTFINGVDTGLISPYRMVGGELQADVAELRLLGFHVDETRIEAGGRVALSRIPGLVYRLDTLKQVVEITVAADQLESHRYDVSIEALRPRVSPGVVLNYDSYGQQSRSGTGDGQQTSNLLSGFLDLRAFNTLGTFTQSAILRSTDPEPAGFERELRLDTTVTHSDIDRLDFWRAGDLISGASLSWVTPVRLGGLQWQRNFRLQPNLITFPLPSVSGSAAVPSTVDIMVNNIRQVSRPVEPGPFTIDNVPIITGQGEIQVVVRDALGREQATTLPFYASSSLLRPGLVDFSLETGYLRRNFGVVSSDYDSRPAGAGSLRAGVTPWATLEAHAEGARDLVNGGAGAVLRAGVLGVVAASYAGSSTPGARGMQWSAAYQWQSGRLGVSASTRRSSPAYLTLASSALVAPTSVVDQASVTTALGRGGLSLGYAGVKGTGLLSPASNSNWTRIGTLSYSLSLSTRWSLAASVFRSSGATDDLGGALGLACFLDNHLSVAANGQYSRNSEVSANLQATQPLPAEGTGPGWRMQAGSGDTGSAAASAGYRFQSATVEAGVGGDRLSSTDFLALRGAVVAMDARHWPMLTNTIHESFALVNTGLPNVKVLYENRPMGRSGDDALLLIPNLASQTRNSIAIDPLDVPLDADIGLSQEVAVPIDRTGVLVEFPIARANAATVVLQLPDGSPVPAGASVSVNGQESFIVGYDGMAYLKHLSYNTVLVAEWSTGRCRTEFAYQAQPGVAPRIGPLTCTRGRRP